MAPPLHTTEALRRYFRLTVAYDGTDFRGWQVQPGLPTIQGTLAQALHEITGETVLPQGSGRTDTGVHAEAQVVSVSLAAPIPTSRLHLALNRRLPPSIRVLTVVETSATFHARSNVLDKTYDYRIFQRSRPGTEAENICPPHIARYAWDCPWTLDLARMQAAAGEVIGTHDLTSFAATDPDRTARNNTPASNNSTTSDTDTTISNNKEEPRSNIRTVYDSRWTISADDLLHYTVRGSGFLHNTVRILVGTMVDIGAGRLAIDSIPAILAATDRTAAGRTAPPQGLHLVQVRYKDDAA